MIARLRRGAAKRRATSGAAGAEDAEKLAETIELTVAADSKGDIERYRKWLRSRVVSVPPAAQSSEAGLQS